MEAVSGDEIFKSQAPSNNAQKMYKENHTSKRRTYEIKQGKIGQKFKCENRIKNIKQDIT